MSRAFVSEDATDAAATLLPERPVSAAPNLVTQRGLDLMDAEIERLHAAIAAAPDDEGSELHLARDLRYWRIRRDTAQLVPPDDQAQEVAFGCQVTIRRGDGAATDGDATATYRIVGEDEADPRQGLLSYVSPLAHALIGARTGDVVEIGGDRPDVTVLAIAPG